LGGLGGAATGPAVEDAGSVGLTRDEIVVGENALRDGRCVLIAWVDDDAAATRVRRALETSHVQDVDAAREAWWIGLRDQEAAAYGDRFGTDEAVYRRGFEAACRHDDTAALGDVARQPAFQAGYARGRAYADAPAGRPSMPSAPL
jgi:hypothetical protein